MVTNQYEANQNLWDDRYGALALRIRNWQFAFTGALAIAALSAATTWRIASQQRVVPYIVAVDRLGNAQAILQPLNPSTVDVRAKLAFVTAFISNARTVLTNPSQQRYFVLDNAYAVTRGQARVVLSEYEHEADPFTLGQTAMRKVQIEYARQIPTDPNSFEIAWTEHTEDLHGITVGRDTRWEAKLGITLAPPSAEQAKYLTNPYGIFVTSLAWSKQIIEDQANAS